MREADSRQIHPMVLGWRMCVTVQETREKDKLRTLLVVGKEIFPLLAILLVNEQARASIIHGIVFSILDRDVELVFKQNGQLLGLLLPLPSKPSRTPTTLFVYISGSYKAVSRMR